MLYLLILFLQKGFGLIFIFSNIRDWAWGLTHAKQVSYHGATLPAELLAF